jgi:glycosyltransferase involved in cell wall biosynthesis
MSSQANTLILYPGALPIFHHAGTHPQFNHLATPPRGYAFIEIDRLRPNRLRRCLIKLGRLAYVVRSTFAFALSARGNNVDWADVCGFVSSRRPRFQLEIPINAELLFLPSYPFILNQAPWIIEIEDITTLFDPFIENGKTHATDVKNSPAFRLIKTLLESAPCKGIICHVKSTAESVVRLFGSPTVESKTYYSPMGVSVPAIGRSTPVPGQPFSFLFTNSWHQNPDSFYLRGGLDVLEAFRILSAEHPNARLLLRTKLPADLAPRYKQYVASDERIVLLDQFLTKEDMDCLIAGSNAFLLPSARLHVMSVLEAMSFGLPVIVSDGWGMEEYVTHCRNGLVVRGRYGKCSWVDKDGMLREDYRGLRSPDAGVTEDLARNMGEVMTNNSLREEIGRAARHDVETRFSLDSWNRRLRGIFNEVLSK